MSNKDFYQRYDNLLTKGGSVSDLQNFLIELSQSDEPNIDAIKEVSHDLSELSAGTTTIDKIQDRVLASSIESKLNQVTPQIKNTKISSATRGWTKANMVIGLVAGGIVLSGVGVAINQANKENITEQSTVKDEIKKYTELEVKEGTTHNVNDFNTVIDIGGTIKKETAEAGYADSYDVLNKKYIVKKDEDIVKLIYALNYEEIDPLQLANLENFGITLTADDLNDEMNQFYNFMIWDSMTVTSDEKSTIDFSKLVAREKDANYLMEAQRSNQRFNEAKTREEKVKVAKEELGKWIPILENKADLPTNQAVLSILQAQLDGFVENMELNLITWTDIEISQSKWANIAWDLPKCQELTDDQLAEQGVSAYWRGNVRTEDSDISLTRWRRFDAFENVIKKVNDVRENPNAKRLTQDKISLAELEKQINTSAVKQNGGKAIEVIPNPDPTKAIREALLNEKGGVIDLQPGETLVQDPNGNYVIKDGTTTDNSVKLPTEKEAEDQIKEESKDMSQEAKDMEPAGYNAAVSSGALNMDGMKMPSGLSEAEQNGYRAGYSEGVANNKVAYQLGVNGQELTPELSKCTVAYNEGKKVYEQNKEQETDKKEEEDKNYQQLVDEAYDAGLQAGLAAAQGSTPTVPGKYQSVSSDYLRGFKDGQYQASLNIGEPEDVLEAGEGEKEETTQPTPEPAPTPAPETPKEEVSTVTADEVAQAARANAMSRLYNGDYIIQGADTTMPACPEEYKAHQAAWESAWNQVLQGYLMNMDTEVTPRSFAATPEPTSEVVAQVESNELSEIEQLKQLKEAIEIADQQTQELDDLISGKTR